MSKYLICSLLIISTTESSLGIVVVDTEIARGFAPDFDFSEAATNFATPSDSTWGCLGDGSVWRLRG